MIRVPQTTKILAIVSLANLLELYDFTLFAVLLPVIAVQFFPGDNCILIGYLVFAVSFLIAPIGSIIWGYVGDRFGSNVIFKSSLLIMAAPSLAISMLPTYKDIGWTAPILLIAFRILQGFSVSGEILTAKIYAFERLGQNKALIASSIISATGAIGVLLSVASGAYISSYLNSEYSNADIWRIPFAIGGILMFVVLLIRTLIDKNIIDKSASQEPRSISIFSVINVIKRNPRSALNSFAASSILGIFSYFMHAFLINFQVSYLGYELTYAYQAAEIGLVGTVVFAMFTACSKRISKRIDYLLNSSLLAGAILSAPLYLMLLLKIEILTYISLFIMGGLLGVFASASGVYVIKLFVSGERCRGALLVNALGVAVFGGLTPLIMTILAGVNIILPGIMLSVSFIIGYICIYA